MDLFLELYPRDCAVLLQRATSYTYAHMKITPPCVPFKRYTSVNFMLLPVIWFSSDRHGSRG